MKGAELGAKGKWAWEGESFREKKEGRKLGRKERKT